MKLPFMFLEQPIPLSYKQREVVETFPPQSTTPENQKIPTGYFSQGKFRVVDKFYLDNFERCHHLLRVFKVSQLPAWIDGGGLTLFILPLIHN